MRWWLLLKRGLKQVFFHKGRSFLISLGSTIGIACLTVIMAISHGTDEQIRAKVAGFGGRMVLIVAGHGRMSKAVGGSDVKLRLSDAKAVAQSIVGVEDVAASATGGNFSLKAQNSQTKCWVTAIEPNWHEVLDWWVIKGEPISQSDDHKLAKVCLLGNTIKKELFGSDNPVGQYLQIGGSSFLVKGLLEIKGATGTGHDRDRRVVIPMTTGLRRLFNQRHINVIRAKMQKNVDLDQAAKNIVDLLNQRKGIDPKVEKLFTAITTQSLIRRFKGVSDTVYRLLIAVTVLSLLVGGLVVMNVMLSSVSQRKVEIGLLRAVGAGKKDISFQFLMEALNVNCFGLIFGWILGLVSLFILSKTTELPIVLTWQGFLWGGFFAFIVGIFSGVVPAKKAAELDPVEALR